MWVNEIYRSFGSRCKSRVIVNHDGLVVVVVVVTRTSCLVNKGLDTTHGRYCGDRSFVQHPPRCLLPLPPTWLSNKSPASKIIDEGNEPRSVESTVSQSSRRAGPSNPSPYSQKKELTEEERMT